MTVFYQNVRGLRTKLQDVYLESHNLNYDVIILTETWLLDSIPSSELFCPSYSVYRRDRDSSTSLKQRGGGVLIAVRSDYPSSLIKLPSNFCEEIYVSLLIENKEYVFGGVYLPPDSGLDVYHHHVSSVDYLLTRCPNSAFCIAGDYNMPGISWQNGDAGLLPVSSGAAPWESEVCDSLTFLGLLQLNNILNHNSVVLDLVFSTSGQLSVEKSDVNLVPPDLHHPSLTIDIPLSSTSICIDSDVGWKFNFKKAPFDIINDYFCTFNWRDILSDSDINHSVSIFNEILYTAYDKFIPKYYVNSGNYPSWFSLGTKRLLKKKNNAFKRYKRNRSNISILNTYKQLRIESKNSISHDYNNYLSFTQNNVHLNPKIFWNFINNKRRTNGLPKTMFYNNNSSSDMNVISNMFASFFQSVYSVHPPVTPILEPTHYCNSNLIFSVSVTIDIVFHKLSALSNSFFSGPDEIPPYFLKHCSPSLAFPISLLYNLSLASATFPLQWKSAFVVPLFKSGDRSDIQNYRPISALPALGKVLESIVTDEIISTFSAIIIPEQHGFMSGRSTETNLLLYHRFISESLENGHQVDSIYTDLSKAFDRVDHQLLLWKLGYYGITGSLWHWFGSYLLDRTQCIRLGSNKSDLITVTSGVPQGSHLGPILFLLFINDIKYYINYSKFLLFADDLKLFSSISSLSNCIELQSDFDGVSAWCRDNNMLLNIDKCKIITFTKKKSNIIYHPYATNSGVLDRVDQIKDLGVLFDSSLNFNLHIDVITCRALKLCGFIKRQTKDFTNVIGIFTLYHSLVRSILEYCSIIWNPYTILHSEKIERVQRKFVNYILFKLNIDKNLYSYPERLNLLNLQALSSRRRIALLSFGFKCLNNIIDSSELLSLFNLRVPIINTRCTASFALEFHRTTYGCNNPLNLVFRELNALSGSLDIFSIKPAEFKKYIKLHVI